MKKFLLPAISIAIFITLFYVFVLVPGNSKFTYGYGEHAEIPSGDITVPRCGAPKPATPWLYGALPVGSGAVNLYWTKTTGATHYMLLYGLSSGNYIYGASNIGNSDTRIFKVSGLTPGKTYYFKVAAENDCQPGDFSNELSYRVPGGYVPTYSRTGPVGTTPPSEPTPTRAPFVTRVPGRPGEERPVVTPVEEDLEVSPQVVTTVPRIPGEEPFTPPSPTPTPRQNFIQRFFNFLGGLFR